MIELHDLNENEVMDLGARLAAALDCQGSVHLKGDLGAGKTTLCRAILRAMGHSGAVKSPTFTLVEPYRLDKGEVFHFDFYRLGHPEELEYIGIDEYFGENRLCLIEWPDRAAGYLPAHDIEISIDVCQETRNIGISAVSGYGEKVCKSLAELTSGQGLTGI